MHLPKTDLPVKMNALGATARHLPDFGIGSGPLAAEYFTLAAGVDIAPLLQGLRDDGCQAEHWGYLINGRVVVTYSDDSEETCSGGDVFYWPAGHSVRVEDDADIILFSAQEEHQQAMNHMLEKLAMLPA